MGKANSQTNPKSTNNKFWQFRNLADDDQKAELLLYGDISERSWWEDAATPKRFADDLAALGDVKEITVYINSGGGDVFAAQAIGNMLERNAATVTAHIDGLCASAATIVACHADKVVAAADGSYMVHPVSMGVCDYLTAEDMKNCLKALETIRSSIITLYAKKSGKTEDECAKWMDETNWWTATEAQEKGFVDEVDDDAEDSVVENRKGNRKMAAFIHPLVGGEIVQSEGYETKSYAPPLINPATISTADQYMERLPGEDLFSGRTPADRAAEKLIEEYNQLNDMTTRREEWMAAQVLTTGKLKVKGKGVDEVIDFGFGNKITLEGTKQWGKSAADPWGNLRDWKQLVSRNGFANADMVVMGKVAADNFMADGKILELMDKRRFDIGSMAPKELEGGLTYYGHLNLPGVDVYGYDEVYLDDVTGETKPLIPDNMVLMIPSNANFMRAYGLCNYLDDGGNWHSFEGDRLLRTYVEHRPDRRFIELQSHPLLIPDKVDSWLVAEVC